MTYDTQRYKMGKIEQMDTKREEYLRDGHACDGSFLIREELDCLFARLDAAESQVSILQTANDNIASALHEVEDQRDALQAVVDKLPKDKNGAPICPGDRLVDPVVGVCVVEIIWKDGTLGVELEDCPGELRMCTARCYTHKAALAACHADKVAE